MKIAKEKGGGGTYIPCIISYNTTEPIDSGTQPLTSSSPSYILNFPELDKRYELQEIDEANRKE